MARVVPAILVYLVLTGLVTRGQPVAPAPPQFSEFDVRLIKFNNVWAKYFRDHFHCPPEARTGAECHPDMGAVDYSGYVHIANQAWKTFGPAIVERGKEVPCDERR